MQHSYISVNGIRMHYVSAGSGPLLLLLHGFPEFWYSWRHQIAAFSPHFTVVAPDLRGYNETDKPTWGYEIDVLVQDVVELIEKLGFQQAYLSGHDWGGMVAWVTAMTFPHRVARLMALNIPHPACFARELRTNPRQRAQSWYAGMFQLPFLPEAVLSANDYAAIELAIRGTAVHKERFTDEDIAAYKDAISKPGALTAALNWYRAVGRTGGRGLFRDVNFHVPMPTLHIWGEKDTALAVETTNGTEQYVPNYTLHRIPDASHWVQQDRPDLVNDYMRAFLADVIAR
ncbi:MAG: alpha/beta hydrolase [Chloroflexaceae bacterium]|jgi:pimeloyl-ACP methyl ester carboxylesterase|nr:alpha/beta hydrolase [Chloroflexaceae bacterium]